MDDGRGRVLAIDVGGKRTGLAISDVTRTLARPLEVIQSATPLAALVARITELQAEDDGLSLVVIGLPLRLDGTPNEQTPRVRKLAELLTMRIGVPVRLQDERLTSVEAESRLAVQEKDWKRRKAKLDAAAAAIILQEYLDARS